MSTCVNLMQFSLRYKVDYEESYYAERVKRTKKEPWLLILLCQNGHICPWGDDLLAACTKRRGGIAIRLKKLPFVVFVQDGDDGANIVFPSKHLEEVLAIMRPKRRRVVTLTDEQKEELRERLERSRRRRASRSSIDDVMEL